MGFPKELARKALYFLRKKDYKCRLYEGCEIKMVSKTQDREYFYGYYDRCPERNGILLFHEKDDTGVNIIVRLQDGQELTVGHSSAFNWQMGARTIWVNDDVVSWNDFDGEKYVCKWFSLTKRDVVKIIPMAVMEYCGSNVALAPNFRRLRNVNPEYGYQPLPALTNHQMEDLGNDGIWMYDINKERLSLLLSLKTILECKPTEISSKGLHCVNHITSNHSGNAFFFIHRHVYKGKRYDRLMLYDFNSLTCLLDDPIQSHFCWIDDKTIMGYGTYKGALGFYSIDIDTGKVICHEALTRAHPGDGHPTVSGEWVVVDSYPDFARMQHLIAYNLKTGKVIKLAEVFHDMIHANETRCDLHPRFKSDGSGVYFDSICSGRRALYLIDIPSKLMTE